LYIISQYQKSFLEQLSIKVSAIVLGIFHGEMRRKIGGKHALTPTARGADGRRGGHFFFNPHAYARRRLLVRIRLL